MSQYLNTSNVVTLCLGTVSVSVENELLKFQKYCFV